jgi:hypothetical protein
VTQRQKICIINEELEFNQEENSDTKLTVYYEILDYVDVNAARLALLQTAPFVRPDYPHLVRREVQVDEYDTHPGEFSGEVTYEQWTPDSIGDEVISGGVGIQTVNVTYSYFHVGDYGPGGGEVTIQSFGGLNIKEDEGGFMVPQGFDVEFPTLNFSIKKTYLKGYGIINTLVTLNGYVGKPNSVPWRGFGPQTVKLSGVEVATEDADEDVVTYSFSASPTVTNIVIPTGWGSGAIVIPEKKGWELLTITSKAKEINGSHFVSMPHTAHINQLTPLVNLNDILP